MGGHFVLSPNTGLGTGEDLTKNFKNIIVDNDDDDSISPYNAIGHTCNYFEQEEFTKKTESLNFKFSTFSNNIRSLPGKFSEFSELINSLNTKNFKFSVIALQEIWNVPPNSDFSIPGYNKFEFKTRDPTGLNSNAGGGVGLWVDNSLSYKPLEHLSIFEPHIFESQFFKVDTPDNKFIIVGNIYRPNTLPLANINRFNEILNNILNDIHNDPVLDKASDIQLVSDSNIDLLQYRHHAHTMTYLDTLLSHGQLPLITLPTRITQNSAAIIEHISTSSRDDVFDAGIIHSSLSDHLPVFYIKHKTSTKPTDKFMRIRKINPATSTAFDNLLKTNDWTNVTNEMNPKNAFNNFFEVIDESVNIAFPEISVKVSQKNAPINPWMTQGLLISRKHKEKLFTKKLNNPSPNNVTNFKKFNVLYNKLLRLAKKVHYDNKFTEFSKNMRKTWDTIREVIGSTKRRENVPDTFFYNGEFISGADNIAKGFNTFFSGIGPELANSITPTNKSFRDYLGEPNGEHFIFGKITPKILTEIAGKMLPKKSAGPDFISTKLLKQILPTIVSPLCHIFNLSLQTGYIPTQLKTAKVVPVFKSGDKNLYTNYRPISLLSSFSKLLEKLVARQMVGFLHKHNLLYKHQYGFRKAHSTSHPIIHFLNKIHNALNKNNPELTLGIFLDLKKAFDTVDHSILLQKMDHYGFKGTVNLWFKNYLKDRQQFVNINGINSDTLAMSCGVPQGSVLGPLLFLIFINDLPNTTNFLTLLFADDTTFQLSGQNVQELFQTANIELNKAAIWFQTNKLTLNVKKTKFILFRSKNMQVDFSNINLKIGGSQIERIGEQCDTKWFKFVGHHMDEYLTWEYQIAHVHSKLASANFAIAKVKNLLPRKIKLTLYNSLFKSHLEFGILAWGGVKSSKLKRIIVLQKKCVRNVGGKNHMAHTDPLFTSLNVLKFQDLFSYTASNFMHKYLHNKTPDSFSDMFTTFAEPNRTKNFQLCRVKNNFLEQFPAYFLPKLWNLNSLEHKNILSHNSFKKNTFKNYISQYPLAVNCNNVRCPDCTT